MDNLDRIRRRPHFRILPALLLFSALAALGACDDGGEPLTPEERPFLSGTEDDPQIGLVVNSTGRALTLFQLGDPDETRTVELGASAQVTPVGLSLAEEQAAVPLGNAASVALIDLRTLGADDIRYFRFPEGNATGSAFVDAGTVVVGNLVDDYVGRFTLDQESDEITDTVSVTPAPSAILERDGRVFVISANLDEQFQPADTSRVTELDPATMTPVDSVSTGGENAQDAAFGPNGLLYVVNTGNFVDPGSIAVIDPETLERMDVVEDIGVGPGSIWIDDDGLAYISGTFFGTLVWDTDGGDFVRGPDDPVCAPLEDGECRGAFDAETDASGRLHQAFFGSTAEGLSPRVFVYEAGTFELTDSIAAGTGPTSIDIQTF